MPPNQGPRENRQLKEDREILSKAVSFAAQSMAAPQCGKWLITDRRRRVHVRRRPLGQTDARYRNAGSEVCDRIVDGHVEAGVRYRGAVDRIMREPR
jgi:hypothetical protein